MTLDLADDLEAAEDRIGSLQASLRSAAEILHGGHHPSWFPHGPVGFKDCHLEPCVEHRKLLEPFLRPSCAERHDTGSTCEWSCDGHHSWPTAEGDEARSLGHVSSS